MDWLRFSCHSSDCCCELRNDGEQVCEGPKDIILLRNEVKTLTVSGRITTRYPTTNLIGQKGCDSF